MATLTFSAVPGDVNVHVQSCALPGVVLAYDGSLHLMGEFEGLSPSG